jgi:P27 family predicted phage terminase small subunit
MPTHSQRPTAGRRKALDLRERDAPRPAPIPAPSTLPPAARRIWESLAPAAERMRTLVPESIPGFVLLCETLVQRDEAWARLAADGLTVSTPTGEVRAHPLTTHARQLGQRAESLMARYALTAPGRPVERPRAPEDDAVSKWERLTRRPES